MPTTNPSKSEAAKGPNPLLLGATVFVVGLDLVEVYFRPESRASTKGFGLFRVGITVVMLAAGTLLFKFTAWNMTGRRSATPFVLLVSLGLLMALLLGRG